MELMGEEAFYLLWAPSSFVYQRSPVGYHLGNNDCSLYINITRETNPFSSQAVKNKTREKPSNRRSKPFRQSKGTVKVLVEADQLRIENLKSREPEFKNRCCNLLTV
jgi:hypothetical protein